MNLLPCWEQDLSHSSSELSSRLSHSSLCLCFPKNTAPHCPSAHIFLMLFCSLSGLFHSQQELNNKTPGFRKKLSSFSIFPKFYLHAIGKAADNLWSCLLYSVVTTRLFICPFHFFYVSTLSSICFNSLGVIAFSVCRDGTQHNLASLTGTYKYYLNAQY